MIHTKNFSLFHTLIADFKKSNIQFKLYGNAENTFKDSNISFGTEPKKNTLSTCIVALSTIGTILYKADIDSNDTETVNNIKTFFEQHDIIQTTISYNEHSNKIQFE